MQQGNPPFEALHLHYFDKSGNYSKTDSIGFNADYESSLGGLVDFKKGYLKLGTLFSGIDTGKVILTQFNENLDSLRTWDYSYMNQQSTEAQSVHFFEPNTILITGMYFVRAGNQRQGLAIALDTNFNLKWEKTYLPVNQNNPGGYILNDAISTNGDGYVFGGERINFTNDSSIKDKGLIIKVDSLGNEEWRREISGPKGSNKVLLQELNDTSFTFICSQKIEYLQNDFYRSRLRFGTISLNNRIHLDTLFSYDGVDLKNSFFHKNKNGDYITGGYIHNPNWGSYAMSISAAGDSLWFRNYFYGPDRVLDIGELQSMTFTQDGGMLFAGYFLDRNGNGANMWLIKTDSLGCDTPGCQNIGLEELITAKQSRIQLYPNPAKGEVSLLLDHRHLKDNKELTIRVLNQLGQVINSCEISSVQLELKLDISTLPAGTYMVEVKGEESTLGFERLVIE